MSTILKESLHLTKHKHRLMDIFHSASFNIPRFGHAETTNDMTIERLQDGYSNLVLKVSLDGNTYIAKNKRSSK